MSLCDVCTFKREPSLIYALIILCFAAGSVYGQEVTQIDQLSTSIERSSVADTGDKRLVIKPIRTDSPRSTLATFLRLREDLEQSILAYRRDRNADIVRHVRSLRDQFIALMDVSMFAEVSQRETGIKTMAYLLDILGRVQLPDLETVPEADEYDSTASPARWRIPETPIWLVRVEAGPREGEFLFGPQTVLTAPRFYLGIQDLPLKSSLSIESWHRALPQLTGPLVPAALLRVIPGPLQELWLDTPKWKVLVIIFVSAISAGVMILFHRWVNRRRSDGRIEPLLRRALTPAAILMTVSFLSFLFLPQIVPSGDFSAWVDGVGSVVVNLAFLWLIWVLVLALFERVIQLRNLPDDSFDAHLWRLGGRVMGVMLGSIVVARAAQALGLPLYTVLAGLGIGGLAVALAIRPTLENLIGGIMLYLDQPIRVGDFCSFGDQQGTVESIGVRTTKLRALDRTVISVPNAQLADMQLTNWAKCDMMLIATTIGLRYETAPDQIRYALVKFREMFHAHPKIDSKTVRVRFSGFGASSLDIGIRIYALTRDFNEFHAIREDVFLRMSDIVKASGSGFAFPSQTLYLRRDEGLDQTEAEEASRQVDAWRKAGKLPFPRLKPDRIAELENTLDYPPHGSNEASHPELQQGWNTSEQISTEPVSHEEPQEDEVDKQKPGTSD